ncbi:MAG: hypothetical protein LBH85_01500 [Treponema sp.]|jgi:hypothetical protein|nr:hypothetical protein [Treponema sp.]
MNRIFFFSLLLAAFAMPLAAQDFGFGFGDDDAATDGGGGNFGVAIGGEVSASLLGYADDFSQGLDKTGLGDIFSGKLNFSAGNSFGEAVINLNLASPATGSSLITFDEAYLRAYLGALEIEGGLRKLTWGKADSFGPLDVINPLDYSEITDASDALNMKIARPLVHATARFGQFSKLEVVFVPTFEPHRFASEGRWRLEQMKTLQDMIAAAAQSPGGQSILLQPDVSKLNYAQAGLRFTTTIGSSDIGAQYYYGRLPTPAIKLSFAAPQLSAPSKIELLYNPYHHIGVDYAQVLFGFNVRVEFAANITDDLGGDNAEVYNPNLAWSAGFDRDLVWGINLNLQANETVRLFHENIQNGPLSQDVEADSAITSTRITAILSKKFLRDELEARFVALWEVEVKDFFLMPSIIWTRDAVQVEVAGGIFTGDEKGQFGQYHKNNFVKVGLTYSF